MRPQLLGNLSGDEDEYEKDGTPILVKIEEMSDDSEEENTPENDNEGPEVQTAPTAQTRTQTASPDAGTSDSSSEEDDEPPTDKAVE